MRPLFLMLTAGMLALAMFGCAGMSPPGTEADALLVEVNDFAATLNTVATAQLADDNLGNDASAEQVKLVTSIVQAVLTGQDDTITDPVILAIIDLVYKHDIRGAEAQILSRIKDPYAAGIAVWFARHLDRWLVAKTADLAAKQFAAPAAP